MSALEGIVIVIAILCVKYNTEDEAYMKYQAWKDEQECAILIPHYYRVAKLDDDMLKYFPVKK